MKESPIIFSTPMVQAILEGHKTQTRRIVKAKRVVEPHEVIYKCAEDDYWIGTNNGHFMGHSSTRMKCPYGKPGDLLWVRENFGYYPDNGNGVLYFQADDFLACERWKPSIHLPKLIARIWLEIVSIKVERIQAITEDDCIAEGVHFDKDSGYYFAGDTAMAHTPQSCFTSLWTSIGNSWLTNPFVWVIEFKELSRTGKPQ